MARFFKKGKSETDLKNEDSKVRETVQNMIRAIEAEGDAAVRKYSASFDNWSPGNFRLSDRAISEIVSNTPQQVIDDILFAQQQIRFFSESQRASDRKSTR